MSENNQENASGSVEVPSGDSGRESVEERNSVDYKSYKKLLTERKNDKQRMQDALSELESYRAREREESERKAEQAGQWDQLKSSYQERINSLESELQLREEREQKAVKLHSFLEKVPGKVESQYFGLINLEDIQVDPESGNVDEMSLESAVNGFVQKYNKIIDQPGKASPPSYGKLGSVNYKKSIKDLSTEELKNAFISGKF